MKKNRKFMLCQYPGNGFGKKNNQFYLLDVFGNRYDIVDEYDKTLEEMNKVVRLGNGANDVYCESTLDELISAIEQCYDTKIVRW